MRRSRASRLGVFLVVSATVACSSPLEPNTDLGLRVYASVSVARVSRSDLSATFTVDICAVNSAHRAVIVSLGAPSNGTLETPRPGDGTLHAYRIANTADELDAGPAASSWRGSVDTIPARTRSCQHFRPVEMSNWREGWDVPPGEYAIRSFYNGREGAAAHLLVDP
jgi:hypothetical protein